MRKSAPRIGWRTCDVKGLSEGAGAKMDNNVPLAPGCDSGVICCSKELNC